jgi:putative ABC transport system substrate-binding protein
MHRPAARYVERILKGARPGDLSGEQPTKFESGDLKTAKAIGLTLSPSIRARADEVVH